MKNINKLLKLLIVTLFLQSPLAAQATISKPVVWTGAIAVGILSGAAAFGICQIIDSYHTKNQEALLLADLSEDDINDFATLELANLGEQELSDLATQLNNKPKFKKNRAAKHLIITAVSLAFAVLGGAFAYQILYSYTNEGRIANALDFYRKKLGKKNDLLARLANHDNNWKSAEFMNLLEAECGSKFTLVEFEKYLDRKVRDPLAAALHLLEEVSKKERSAAWEAAYKDIAHHATEFRNLHESITTSPEYKAQLADYEQQGSLGSKIFNAATTAAGFASKVSGNGPVQKAHESMQAAGNVFNKNSA
jgi:hypothetical protein